MINDLFPVSELNVKTTARHLIMAGTLFVVANAANAQADAKPGEKAYADCVACHPLQHSPTAIGPDLHGIFGRRAGEGDFRYSPALKRSNITWTPETMNAFITDPQVVVPGNRMPYSGMNDARARADLVMYMQQVFK